MAPGEYHRRMLLVLALALPLTLAGSRALTEGLDATDSTVRANAVYVLARTHDRTDTTATSRVERILTTAPPQERIACVRGLMSREWTPAMPEDLQTRLGALLADPDPAIRLAVVDSARFLPAKQATLLLLKEEPLAELV